MMSLPFLLFACGLAAAWTRQRGAAMGFWVAGVLVLLARQWCGTPEDVVQEAFLKLSAATPIPNHPAAWLFRVVRNAAVSAGRSERRRGKHEAQSDIS